ncbi:DNA polymerase III subunit beta [Thermicanus aegyptius]|uniref:DNA polymerase III subunit beta n=1 Tax=Thermicanus aegyptius TaxID=94009 RepID=UPI0004230119|nr:DNA polymerase III subunit beta [Thermicanus aegyptius]
MHLWIDREQLVYAIQTVSRAVSSRVVIPILAGIKIDADDEKVTFTASDSDLSISYSYPIQENTQSPLVKVEQTGSIVLSARIIGDMVKRLPDGYVEIEEKEHGLVVIHSETVEFNLHGMDPEDYPQFPSVEDHYHFRLHSSSLRKLLKQVIIASSNSDSRPILKGIEWTLKNGKLSLTATDSHRLAKGTITLSESDVDDIRIVVPSKNSQELIKLLEDREEEVEILLSNTQLLLKAENLFFISRLLEGRYPDTSMIIPKGSKTQITLSTDSLQGSLERAQLIAQHERNHVVRISSIENQEIEVYAFFPEVGKFSERIRGVQIEGEEIKISFNVKYLLDALRTVDHPEVELHFSGPVTPFLIHPKESDEILHLIVPVRTN